MAPYFVVLYLRKYKFWKQFTTNTRVKNSAYLLCCIYENTNFESNSQPLFFTPTTNGGCVVSTKIQILKAIHNQTPCYTLYVQVVLYLRKYKFWKQFTTRVLNWLICFWLCCIYENTNFESNSQLYSGRKLPVVRCVVSTKIQILKAIHNIQHFGIDNTRVVLYLRKYKFWKQFTTMSTGTKITTQLCCIYENTNFESNSQLGIEPTNVGVSCVVSTKIQILKAIHNVSAVVQ